MSSPADVLRYAAFTTDPTRGNPAGIVLEAADLSADDMVAIAATVGYSETAFVTGPIDGEGHFSLRYFSPLEEVTFCGHATIATAAALAENVGRGTYTAHTQAGPVVVTAEITSAGPGGSFDSPVTGSAALPDPELATLVACLGWKQDALDPR